MQVDDWKGEHLIRGQRYHQGEQGRNMKKAPTAKQVRYCAHYGCGKKLNANNVAGVCAKHQHGPHCKCDGCKRRPGRSDVH